MSINPNQTIPKIPDQEKLKADTSKAIENLKRNATPGNILIGPLGMALVDMHKNAFNVVAESLSKPLIPPKK